MVVETELIFKTTEVVLSVAASMGARTLVKEAVKKCTPENLGAAKEFCVSAAQWAITGATAGVCCTYIHGKVEKTKNLFNKITAKVDAAPDDANKNNAEEEEIEIIQIVDKETVEMLS